MFASYATGSRSRGTALCAGPTLAEPSADAAVGGCLLFLAGSERLSAGSAPRGAVRPLGAALRSIAAGSPSGAECGTGDLEDLLRTAGNLLGLDCRGPFSESNRTLIDLP